MIKRLYSILIMLIFLSCQTTEVKKENTIQSFFDNLPGIWRLENGNLIEKWEKDGHLYKATVYKIHRKDSIVTERIKIKEIESDIYYQATVRDQNQNEPVLFKMIETSVDKVVFENKIHDFPQKITYRLIGKDQMIATIQGTMKGKPEKYDFKYSRIRTTPIN